MLNVISFPGLFVAGVLEDVVEDVSSKLERAHGFLGVFIEPGGEYSVIYESASGRVSDNELLGILEKIKLDLILGELNEDEEEAF